MARTSVVVLSFGVAIAALTATPVSSAHSHESTSVSTRTQISKALKAAKQLPVAGWAAHDGYSRDQFGGRWKDLDGNGCDTRNDILRRDLKKVVMSSSRCRVIGGVFTDPYSGKRTTFAETCTFGTCPMSTAIQIDHVVALSNAWVTGAQSLPYATRVELANDPLELIAVSSSLNDQKSDSDASAWLPPRVSYQCAYVARQVAVKRKYHLWVTPSEKATMISVLKKRSCSKVALPTAKSKS